MPVPITPLLTVDAAIFDMEGRLLTITRANPPFQGAYALPGGFVDLNESVEDACRRELFEEAGLKIRRLHLVGVYSKPGRDPRGPTVSIAYAGQARRTRAIAGDDAASVAWLARWRSAPMAFDHQEIARAAAKTLGRLA